MGHLEDRAALHGKVAIVVGGAGGIGGAITRSLAAAGVAVAFCDRDADAVQHTTDELGRRGSSILGCVVDALDSSQLTGFFENFAAAFNELDILVNVVGGTQRRPFDISTPSEWHDDIQRNFGYVLESTRAALPLLRCGRRGGSIVNFTTIEAHRGAAGFAVYAGAKAALANFSRALAVELAAEQIRVNLIAPDTTPSEGNRRAVTLPEVTTVTPARHRDALSTYLPMHDPPLPEDLADAVLFLTSDLSRSVTGTTLHVDGGTWAAAGFQHWPDPYGWLPVVPAALLDEDAFT